MRHFADTQVPRLLGGVRTRYDGVRGNWVLLAPERVLRLDRVGRAIIEKADGTRTFGEIVEALAAEHAAPAERIAADARRFLESLIERRMAEAT